jgi:hypothetical protein
MKGIKKICNFVQVGTTNYIKQFLRSQGVEIDESYYKKIDGAVDSIRSFMGTDPTANETAKTMVFVYIGTDIEETWCTDFKIPLANKPVSYCKRIASLHKDEIKKRLEERFDKTLYELEKVCLCREASMKGADLTYSLDEQVLDLNNRKTVLKEYTPKDDNNAS